MIQRYSVYVLLLAVAVSLSSCRRAVEKARRNIRFEGIERVERQGLTGAEGVERLVVLDPRTKLYMLLLFNVIMFSSATESMAVILKTLLAALAFLILLNAGKTKIAWIYLALYVLARKVKSGDLSQVEVSYAVEGRGGPAPVKISRERMPLSDFLNTFGLTIEDVKKQLK